MSVHEHLGELAGLPVADFDGDTERDGLPPAASVAWRVRTGFEETPFDEVFERFLA